VVLVSLQLVAVVVVDILVALDVDLLI